MSTIHRIAPLAIVGALLLGACQRTVVEQPEVTDYNPNDLTAQLDFWHDLPGRSAVSNDEGLHGIILLFEGSDSTQTYEERVKHLKDLGWLQKSFDEPANLAMQRGTLARLLVKAMDIKGGVMMNLTNAAPRYAYKELVYLGVMPDGSELMVVDGLDYLGVVSRAQDYMVVEGLKEHARDLRYAGEAEDKMRQQQQQPGTQTPQPQQQERQPDSPKSDGDSAQ